MNFLGRYLLSGKLQAIGVITLTTLLSLLVPPFTYLISGAPVGLITLRKGPAYSVQILTGSLVLTSVIGGFTNIGTTFGAIFALGIWSPVWLASMLLRATESQSVMLLCAAGIGVITIIGTYLFAEDLTVLWQSWLDMFLQQGIPAEETARLQQLFEAIKPLLNGVVAAGLVISLVLTVLFARWWQSRLYNPGGFGIEFQQLLLPRWAGLVTFSCLLLSAFESGDVQWQVRNLLIILIVIHVFQGVASVHRIVFTRKISSNWIIGMYVFLALMPQMAVIMACIGLVDVWVRHRKTVPTDKA